MLDDWASALEPERRDYLLVNLAHEIKKRKLETPAILFFEMHKPIAPLSSTGSVMFAPFLVPILGRETVRDYGKALADKKNIDRLLDLLDLSLIQLTELKEQGIALGVDEPVPNNPV